MCQRPGQGLYHQQKFSLFTFRYYLRNNSLSLRLFSCIKSALNSFSSQLFKTALDSSSELQFTARSGFGNRHLSFFALRMCCFFPNYNIKNVFFLICLILAWDLPLITKSLKVSSKGFLYKVSLLWNDTLNIGHVSLITLRLTSKYTSATFRNLWKHYKWWIEHGLHK